MLSKISRLISVLLVLGLAAWVSAVAAQATSSPNFSGQATAVKATAVGTPITLADTGPLPSSGGAQQASLLDASVPGLLTAEVLHASTIGQGDRSRSEASLASLSLAAAGNTVAADFLMAQAMAVCGPGGASTTGSSEIVGLVVDGQPITVTGSPNQTIPLPDNTGKVVINE